MQKFSVSVNDSAKYIVTAKNLIGAIKSALPVIESNEAESLITDVVEIRVSRATVPKKG